MDIEGLKGEGLGSRRARAERDIELLMDAEGEPACEMARTYSQAQLRAPICSSIQSPERLAFDEVWAYVVNT
jgi:hypothetical protein